MLLYGTIPEYPEPKNAAITNTLPLEQTLGYVEPDALFWEKMSEWINLTNRMLHNYKLASDSINHRTNRLLQWTAMMNQAVAKELNSEQLPNETHRFISNIGDSIQQFTLSMIEPHVDRWDWLAGTDTTIAATQQIFQRTVANCPKNGLLYASVGSIYNIYVIVEIGSFLYLTKGATFSYKEFTKTKD